MTLKLEVRVRRSPPRGQNWVGWEQMPRRKWPRTRVFKLWSYDHGKRTRVWPDAVPELYPTLTWYRLITSYRRHPPAMIDLDEHIQALLEAR